MPGLTLHLLNGKVLQILGNKSTVEKDVSTPEILSITALWTGKWFLNYISIGSCGRILWVFKLKKRHTQFCKYMFKYAHAEEHMQADI